jgi:hypothetical protein
MHHTCSFPAGIPGTTLMDPYGTQAAACYRGTANVEAEAEETGGSQQSPRQQGNILAHLAHTPSHLAVAEPGDPETCG